MRASRVVNLAGAPNQRLLDFACAECDSAFARTQPHDTHPRVHEEQPEKSDDDDAPQCPHCDKEFTQRSSMCGTCKTCTACIVAATATMFSIRLLRARRTTSANTNLPQVRCSASAATIYSPRTTAWQGMCRSYTISKSPSFVAAATRRKPSARGTACRSTGIACTQGSRGSKQSIYHSKIQL